MTSDERARLRALYRGIAMPWEAADHVEDGDVIATGTEIICEADDSDMGAVVVVTVDMGFDRECDEAHAALILGAVNALPALLDDSERLAKAERERDEARAEAERLRAEHAALRAAPTFTDGWRAAREAAAKFHEARAGFTAERLGHAEAHPEMMPADVRYDVTEGFRESIAQDGRDADAIRGLALPDDANAAVRAAEDGQRAQCAKFSALWRGVAKKARANSAVAVARAVAAERERDEARAEAERLRARLHRCAQCGADDSAVAACEGDEYPLCGPCAASALREARADAAAALAHTDREVGEICRTLPEALRLAAEDEREACAVICDEIEASCRAMQREHAVAGRHAAASEAWEMAGVAEDCADAIRARGAGGAR